MDRKIPVALLLAIISQTFGIFVWAGQMSHRVEVVERWVEKNDQMIVRMARVEEQLADLRGDVSELKEALSARFNTGS